MNCPICNVVLTAHERHGVEVDLCPKCRGVWLDRGELDKLLDRSDRPVFQRHHRAGDDDYHDDDDHRYARAYGGRERRKSFWRELFD